MISLDIPYFLWCNANSKAGVNLCAWAEMNHTTINPYLILSQSCSFLLKQAFKQHTVFLRLS